MITFTVRLLPERHWTRCTICNGSGTVYDVAAGAAVRCSNTMCRDGVVKYQRVEDPAPSKPARKAVSFKFMGMCPACSVRPASGHLLDKEQVIISVACRPCGERIVAAAR